MASSTITTGTDRYIHVNGLRLRYRESGQEGGPAVVFLHGIMGHAREWDVLVEALAPRFHVYSLDQRGHGLSDRAPEYTASAMASDVVEMIDSLGIAPVHLAGHSMGGMAASLAAADRPDLIARLVLIDCGPPVVSTEVADALPGWIDYLGSRAYSSVEGGVAEWMTGDSLAVESLMRHYAVHNLIEGPDGLLRWRFDAAGLRDFVGEGVTEAELWDAIDRLRVPTLLVRGEHSTALSRQAVEEMLTRLEWARAVEIHDGGHDLGVQQPGRVAEAMLAFFSEI